jgi:hypothetical protein
LSFRNHWFNFKEAKLNSNICYNCPFQKAPLYVKLHNIWKIAWDRFFMLAYLLVKIFEIF